MNERVPTIVLSDIVPTEGLEEDFETSDLGEENDGGNSSYVPSCAPDPILFEPQLDFSIHALKKSAAEGMLDMALVSCQ